jgi:hypothetical protein
MNILTQIALLTGLIAGISFIWLVGRAFSKHALWGLAVLFLSPLTAVIFGMRYWRDEKGPFLVYLATFTLAVTLGLYVFTAKGGWNVVRNALHTGQHINFQISGGIGEGSFVQTSLNTVRDSSVHVHNDKAAGTRQEQSEPTPPGPAEPATNTGGQATPETGTPKVTSAKSIDSTVRYRAAYVPISPSMAEDYVGMTVKVKRLNRPEQDCVLRSVTPTSMGFEQHTRGGTFSFTYKHSEIEKLRVLVKQSY